MIKKPQFQKLCFKCIETFNDNRLKDIFSRRYGFKNGESETLESIGKSYGITRERVRQIEEGGLKVLRNNVQIIEMLKPIFVEVGNYINNYGKVVAEKKLFYDFTGYENEHPENAGLYFILTINEKDFHRFNETDEYHSYWTVDKSFINKFLSFMKSVVCKINDNGKPINYDEFLNHLENYHKIKREIIENYLMISKNIGKNIFNEIGLNKWSEIKPRGVRDKMIILFKKEKKPLHFHKITELINEFFDDRTAYPQTVHNELIKDERFVLVGRGIYALKEWGYNEGTVKDIIRKILEEESKPIHKKTLIEKVLQQRLVNPTTIVINLKSDEFEKLDNDYYRLKNFQ